MTFEGREIVRLEPMTWGEFDLWSVHSRQGFAQQQVDAGLLPAPEAEAYARRQLEELLPSGLATPLHHQWTVRAEDGERVGWLWLRVRPLSSEVEAFVFDVEVVAGSRGRGLGRATMLAAEEVARSLGASVSRLNVFGHNTTAIRLYERLGYAVAVAQLTRSLDDDTATRPSPGPRVELRDMTEAELALLLPRMRTERADAGARSGALPAVEAARKARDDLDRLLPRGVATPGHLLLTGHVEGEPVGEVWLQLRERSDGTRALGHHLAVRDELRGQGYGRALLGAAIRTCRGLGVGSMSLSVPGSDTAAWRLCVADGFALTAQLMSRQL